MRDVCSSTNGGKGELRSGFSGYNFTRGDVSSIFSPCDNLYVKPCPARIFLEAIISRMPASTSCQCVIRQYLVSILLVVKLVTLIKHHCIHVPAHRVSQAHEPFAHLRRVRLRVVFGLYVGQVYVLQMVVSTSELLNQNRALQFTVESGFEGIDLVLELAISFFGFPKAFLQCFDLFILGELGGGLDDRVDLGKLAQLMSYWPLSGSRYGRKVGRIALASADQLIFQCLQLTSEQIKDTEQAGASYVDLVWQALFRPCRRQPGGYQA
ncbi:uncharacterized protein MYCFIDRAFT_177470 [Pseudocercospora fijiensis CIRAD86]|uniref:Uncharacterized protein n=1 Tax=Pseudocercospora fijiensis (strain CIRAD86) TaxID=383855 RepID=M3A7C9_PSEFD|nr:uncharacterized protein MYCFIDRAFT_177470 [Pseudocercospora fijiensis CIRAD86]EME80526.1 hypothetical protein MYCFIDRAFT_177470 [Pseudocercospora fijiensis CIRAD86]